MTTETLTNLIGFKKRAFAQVSQKTISGLTGNPALAARVSGFTEEVLARDEAFWAGWQARTEAFDSFCTKAEVMILEGLGDLTDDESDAIRDAQDA
jgi:hypothetical protein